MSTTTAVAVRVHKAIADVETYFFEKFMENVCDEYDDHEDKHFAHVVETFKKEVNAYVHMFEILSGRKYVFPHDYQNPDDPDESYFILNKEEVNDEVRLIMNLLLQRQVRFIEEGRPYSKEHALGSFLGAEEDEYLFRKQDFWTRQYDELIGDSSSIVM